MIHTVRIRGVMVVRAVDDDRLNHGSRGLTAAMLAEVEAMAPS